MGEDWIGMECNKDDVVQIPGDNLQNNECIVTANGLFKVYEAIRNVDH